MTHLRDVKPVERPDTENCSLTLVIDVSNSMNTKTPSGKTRIQEVNDGINQMINELKTDIRLGSIVDLSIITFHDKGKHEVYQGFCAVSNVPTPIDLKTGGDTYAADALAAALNNIKQRRTKYNAGCWKPWLVFITDGELHDDVSQIGREIRQYEKDGQLRTLCFGVPGFDPQEMVLLSDKVFQIVNYNFAQFFSWVAKSQVAVIQSGTPAPDKEIPLPPVSSEVFIQMSV